MHTKNKILHAKFFFWKMFCHNNIGDSIDVKYQLSET